MPPKSEMVAEAIARFDTAGVRSQLLTLDTVMLQDLGLRLTDREMPIREAIEWLNKELYPQAEQENRGTGEQENGGIDKNAVYRFAAHFRDLYQQVRGENARRIARLRVGDVTDGDTSAAARIARARLIDLVAERLVEANTLDDLSGGEMGAAIATVEGWDKGQMKRAELELRERKLQADLHTAQLKQQELQGKLDEAKRKFDEEMAALAARKDGGRGSARLLGPEDIAAARKAVFGDVA
jgi:hypothetical protein